MTTIVPSALPCVWAHCGTDNAIGAIRDIESRMNVSGRIVRFLVTVPKGTSIARKDCISIEYANPFAFQAVLVEHRPAVVIWAAARIKSSGLNAIHKRGIPVLLVDPPSTNLNKRTWLWRKTTLRSTLKHVDQTIVPDDEKSAIWKNFGVDSTRIKTLPNLQEAILPPGFSETERDEFTQIIGSRPVWFIDQLPLEEMDWIIAAIQHAQRSWPRLLSLVEPQNPDHHSAIRAAFEKSDFTVHERSREGEPNDLTQVFMTDGPDEAGLWYRLAPLCYMGGTLMGQQSPNPLIPAALGSAILHGPRISSHKSAFAALSHQAATALVGHGKQLGGALETHLSPDQSAHKAHLAWQTATSGAQTAEHIAAYVSEKLKLNWVG